MSTATNNDIARAIYLFLVRKGLLSKSKDILSHLDKMINDEKGRVVAKVSSKDNLSEGIKKELTHFLTKRYSANEVSLVSNIDEKLLGGFRIEVNNEVIDLTIKNKIGKLQEYLISNV